MAKVHTTSRDNEVHEDWLDTLLESRPGRGWIVNHHLSIFKTRDGFKVFAGPDGANDSDESFAVIALKTRGQVLELMTACGSSIMS